LTPKRPSVHGAAGGLGVAALTMQEAEPAAESREVVYDDHQLQPLVTNYKQIMLQMSRQ
jgi:hypothetical protein